MLSAALTAAAVSAWLGFSRQSPRPQSFAQTGAIAPPGLALIHGSASFGVASSSGIPRGLTGGCQDLYASLVPQARRLALARASAFARDLGVLAGPLVREFPSGDQMATYFTPAQGPQGCGLPKFGRQPFGATVDDTFALTRNALAVYSGSAATPAPQPATFSPIRSYLVAAPLVPADDTTLRTVDVLGYASLQPDTVTLDVTLSPVARAVANSTKSEHVAAFVSKARAAVRNVAPRAAFADETLDSTMPQMRITIARPGSGLIAKIDRAIAASQPPGTGVSVRRRESLASCESLEERSRRDALLQARNAIVAHGDRGVPLTLAFADEQPVFPFQTWCGPLLDDAFTSTDARSASDDAAVPLGVGAFDAIELRYRRT